MCAPGADLQGTDRAEAGTPTTPATLGLGPWLQPAPIRPGQSFPRRAPASTGSEAERELGDWDDSGLTVLHGLAVDLAKAETALEQGGDGLEGRDG
jgi:hypothetical protein